MLTWRELFATQGRGWFVSVSLLIPTDRFGLGVRYYPMHVELGTVHVVQVSALVLDVVFLYGSTSTPTPPVSCSDSLLASASA